MKRGKKRRDPSREPFASALTDVARKQIVLRLQENDYTMHDLHALTADLARANQKVVEATNQKIGGWDGPFQTPDLSAASAAASASIVIGTLAEFSVAGGKYKLEQRKRAKALQKDPVLQEALRQKHRAWERKLKELQATGALPISERGQARVIAAAFPHASPNTIRGWLRRRNVGRATIPQIKAGDWGGLGG